jgi:RHS repeat-associated protein
MLDPKADPAVRDFFTRLPDADYLPTWFQRMDASSDSDERNAALRTKAHAGTPTVSHVDSLGRPFLSIADNGTDGMYQTRIASDIEGNQRSVTDALGRIVVQYDYDMLGTRIKHSSMEAGARLMLNDAAGKPVRAWDDRGFIRRFTYDALHRPVGLFVTEPAGERLAHQTTYGEAKPTPPETTNHRGRIWQVRDDAGIVTSEAYDFKGGMLAGSRELRADYKSRADWLTSSATSEVFTSSSRFDALGRVIESIAPDGSVTTPRYNDANLLEAVDVRLGGSAQVTPFVRNIDYNAKGQRTRIDYNRAGAPLITTYEYDPDTSRLTRLLTVRPNYADAGERTVQDLRYTFDPSGNITHIQDDAQQPIYFKNQRVEPSNEYTYDAVYRLTEARGREHLGQAAAPTSPDAANTFHINQPHPGDGNAMGTYVETFAYDPVGNFETMKHDRTDPALTGWTRNYAYNEPSLIEPAKPSNRLSSSTVGGSSASTEPYAYDLHGNIVSMPHLPGMTWDFADQLTQVDLLGGGTAYYVYDSAGQRVRKVIERLGALVEERIYLGGYEVYRKRLGGTTALERQTLHVMDDKQRIALVETRTQGDDGSPKQLIRYQFANHLGSSSVELDDATNVISYEEYTAYGSTSYQAVDKAITAAAKRYRFTGKERDEETGFTYHVARYCAPWLGRWTNCDPAGISDGLNIYGYSSCNPVRLVDPHGTAGQPPSGVIGDYKQYAELWDRAVQKALPQFEGATADATRRLFAEQIETIRRTKGLGSNRAKGTAINVSRETYSKVRTAFGKLAEEAGLSVKEIQVHHAIDPVAKNPAQSLEPWNLNLAQGNAATKGSGHNLGHQSLDKNGARLNEYATGRGAVVEAEAEAAARAAKPVLASAAKEAGLLRGAARVAGPILKVVKPVAVGLAVLGIAEGVAQAASSRPATTDTAARMEQTFERVESGAGAAATLVSLAPGPVGQIAGGAQANAEIAKAGIHATGGDDRIVAAAKSVEHVAKRAGWSDVNAETAGAVSAATTSMGEGARVLSEVAMGPVGWTVLASRVWKKW